MLEFLLELTSDIVSNMTFLSRSDKVIVYDKVIYAINQTRVHIRNTRQGNVDQSSAQLSNIWQRTGRELKRIQQDEIQELARTIEEKSKYWSDPSRYELHNLERNEMKLTQVEEKLKRICL